MKQTKGKTKVIEIPNEKTFEVFSKTFKGLDFIKDAEDLFKN